jgi:hypothetical protein
MSRRIRLFAAALLATFALGSTACGGPTGPVDTSVQNSGTMCSVQNSGTC